MSVLVLLSGGLDSGVLTALACHEYPHNTALRYAKVTALWVDYGQPAAREEGDAARNLAAHFGIACAVMRVQGLHLGEMAGDAADGSLRVVTARNALFATLGVNQAVRDGVATVWLGATADDAAYVDCREIFIRRLSSALRDTWGVGVAAPLLPLTKKEIVAKGRRLGLPLELTWSCYEPVERLEPCGQCAACVRRAVACA